MSQVFDRAFIERLVQREKEAVTLVVESFTSILMRAALGQGIGQEASREVVQSTWASFFDGLPRFEGRSQVRTYVFGILYNKLSEHRRDTYKSVAVDPTDEVFESYFDSKGNWSKPPADPEKFLACAQTREIIEKCLDGLPKNQRLAFSLKEIDEEDSPDICKILNVSNTNLGVLLFRARNRLRICLEGKI